MLTPVALPLKLRRWSGTASEGPTRRLGIHDGNGDKVGFVHLGSGLLYLLREGQRASVRRALDELGVAVSGPPPHVLDALPWIEEAFASPATRQRVKLLSVEDIDQSSGLSPGTTHCGEDRYRQSTGQRLPPILIAEYHSASGVLAICYRPWSDSAVGHLKRLGALPVEGTVRVLGDPGVVAENYETVITAWAPGPMDPAAIRAYEQERALARTPSEPECGCQLDRRALQLVPERLQEAALGHFRQAHAHGHSGSSGPADADEARRHRYHDPRGYYRPERLRGDYYNDARDLKGRLPDECFGPEVERWLNEFADQWGGHWAVAAAAHAEAEQPQMWAASRELWERKGRPACNDLAHLSDGRSEGIEYLASRLFRRRVKEGRTWSLPDAMTCPTCTQEFDPSTLDTLDLATRLGPPRWCLPCAGLSWGFSQYDIDASGIVYSDDDITAAVAHFAAVTGGVPAPEWRKRRLDRRLPGEDRDTALMAAAVVPRADGLRGRTWTSWLQLAGVVGEIVRTARGSRATARDGHPCRSLFELAIDDFLHENGIAHTLEPDWPWHRSWNPSGQRRADWALADGTYVEAAGLLGTKAYAEKMEAKAALARAVGITLVVVTPRDLLRLPDVFRAYL